MHLIFWRFTATRLRRLGLSARCKYLHMQTMALFVADPYCSVQSANAVLSALAGKFHVKIFGPRELEQGFWHSVDLVCVPGGFGSAESYHRLMHYHCKDIQNHVAGGGSYLGICMGAYWAGSYYLNILDSADAVQYITQPNTCTRRPHAKNMPVQWQGRATNMYFYDGCAFVGDNSKFATVAEYSNGDAMAIVQGRIGLIGCHPEAQQFWYDSYSWLTDRWQDHSSLLAEFAQSL